MNLQPRRLGAKELERFRFWSKPCSVCGIICHEPTGYCQLCAPKAPSVWAMEIPASAYTADMTGRMAAFWFVSRGNQA